MLAGDVGAATTATTHAEWAPTSSSTSSAEVIVFVDPGAKDLASLARPVNEGATLIVLDAQQDGLAQISDHLQSFHGVREIHLVSHGSDGQIQLGSTLVDIRTLRSAQSDLRAWSQSMTSDGDILLYGCDVASTQSGKLFVRELARLTGADVAASTDRTGNLDTGSDWKLEYHVGIIQSGLALSSSAMERFRGHLAIEIDAASSTGDELIHIYNQGQLLDVLNINHGGLANGNFQTYFIEGENINVNDLRISFVNDVYDPVNGIDRNVGIDAIRIDGVQYETEDSGVYSTGVWNGSQLSSGYQQAQILSANGFFDYGGNGSGSQSTVTIYASGNQGDEQMRLLVDGQEVARYNNVPQSGGTYTYQADRYLGADSIRVEFLNDVNENGFDRNLQVDRIEIDGVTFQSEDPAVFSTGTWLPGDGLVAGFRQNELLTSNGHFQYSAFGYQAPTSGANTIDIIARGTTGDETMQLLIDGNVVQTYTNVSTNLTTHTYSTNQSISADRIRVAFAYSTYAPEVGYDQDLIVDAIRINGQRFETEDPSTFSTGTYVEGQGISAGNFQTETLHSDGYFQYNSSNPPQSTTIGFSSDNFIVNEAEGNVVLTVTRQGSLDGTSTVGYRVPGGFAVPGQDFQPVEGTLVFNPGESQKVFTVPLINDGTPEGTETFTVELYAPTGAAFGANRTTIVTVNDDDNSNPPGSLTVQLPDGFEARRIAGDVNFSGPTGIKIANDGRVFVTEKFGKVYVVENGQRVDTPFLDLESQTYAVGTSQGLAGFALDPNFDSNGHVYVMYTTSENGVRFGRLERYTVSSQNRNQVDPSSRRILIGTNASNGFPDGGDIHLVGDLQFGADGSLLVSYGDAAANGDNNAAFNAQNLDNLGGVIARVNPENGQGYASNPFYTGNPNDVRSKIWVYGLRNPYRFEVADDGSSNPNDGNPGTLYIGDVMYQNSEELNIARGGENFGWPYFQGFDRFLGNENPNNFTSPARAFSRADARTSIAGAIVDGNGWPASYAGNYFHADYTNGWIRSFSLDNQGNLTGERGFATGAFGITDLAYDPVSRQLYFVALNQANGFRGELYAVGFSQSSNGGFAPVEISTGTDGVAFAVTQQEEVWRRDGNSWTQLPGSYTKIAARNANEVWAIDAFGNPARWNGSQWDSINTSEPLSDIAVSTNGTVFATGLGGNILQGVNNGWITIPGTLVDIEADSNDVIWGVNAAGEIYRRAGGAWTRISGTLTDISVGSDGSVWGANAAGQVWRWLGNGWSQQNVTLKSISVTNEFDVWGVDFNDQVRRWNGTDWQFV